MAVPRHLLVHLATEAIRTLVVEQRVLDVPGSFFAELPWASEPAAAFVSLKLAGALRGCIGTTESSRPSLAEEVIQSAIGAASRDPRFPAVQHFELADLMVSVDVLTSPVSIMDVSELDPRRYGLIVRSGSKHGVLLPDIEGVTSVTEQVTIVRQKAGLTTEESAELFRFEVQRYR